MTEVPRSSDNLVEGQNFYDQQPFSTILQDVSAKTQVDVGRLRRLLTLLSREYSRPYDTRSDMPEGKLTARELSQQMQNLSLEMVRKGSVGTLEHEAIRMLGVSLAECPLWSDYIASRLKRSDYNDDGIPTPKIGKYLPMTTYASWVTNTLMRDERTQSRNETVTKLRGIRDVVPEGFPKVSPPGIPSTKGRRPR